MMPPYRVLLVDDHPLFREGLRRQLDADDRLQVVGEASDGKEGLRLCQSLTPDVLVLDMHLPQLSGPEVAQAASTLAAPPRMLALSAYDDASYVHALMDAGAAGYVTKDQHPAVIREAVVAVAEGHGRWFVALPQRPDQLSPLTAREHEVLLFLSRGLDNRTIGDRLFVTENTVRNHLTAIYSKLGLNSAREAIAWAWKHGIADAQEGA